MNDAKTKEKAEKNDEKDEKLSSPIKLYDILVTYIKELLDSRIKHPIIGSIILAFLIYNWKTVLLVFFPLTNSKGTVSTFGDRVQSAQLQNYGLIAPIIFGIIYPIALPYSSWAYNVLLKKARIGIKKIKEEEKEYNYTQKLLGIIGENEQKLNAKSESLKRKSREYSILKRSEREYADRVDSLEKNIRLFEHEIGNISDPEAVKLAEYIRIKKMADEKDIVDKRIHEYMMENDPKYREEHDYQEQDYDDFDEDYQLALDEERSRLLQSEINTKSEILESYKEKLSKLEA